MELITITILGIDYKINCPPEKVDSLKHSASLLDTRLTKMRSSGRMSIEQAAIMVGLNLSDELLQAETAKESAQATWNDKLNALNTKLDEALMAKESQ